MKKTIYEQIDEIHDILMDKYGMVTFCNFDRENWDEYSIDEILLLTDDKKEFLIKKGYKID